jgi:hypothetical protein
LSFTGGGGSDGLFEAIRAQRETTLARADRRRRSCAGFGVFRSFTHLYLAYGG